MLRSNRSTFFMHILKIFHKLLENYKNKTFEGGEFSYKYLLNKTNTKLLIAINIPRSLRMSADLGLLRKFLK